MITSGWQSVVKLAHLISKKRDNNKCYVKFVFWKVFKSSIKLLYIPFLVILHTFFTGRSLIGKLGTQRSLHGHSMGTPRTVGHSKVTWALGHSRQSGNLDTQRTL